MTLHPVLADGASKLGIELPHLASAAAFTRQTLAEAREELVKQLKAPDPAATGGLDLVALGSAAREEMTEGSDFDYLVVAHGVVAGAEEIPRFREAAETTRAKIRAEPPASLGPFGPRLISASDLVDLIGLEEDTNRNLTRRILLLEESASLYRPAAHLQLVRTIISRYLHEHDASSPTVPRFLLNDAIRFWFTIAVDYQAKRWVERPGPKWGLRYLKLRISRKLTYAGNLAALLGPTLRGKPTTADVLTQAFAIPPLARLSQLVDLLADDSGARPSLGETLVIADEFVGALGDREFRQEAGAVASPHAPNLPEPFQRLQKRSDDLQTQLERVFFGQGELGRLARKHLAF